MIFLCQEDPVHVDIVLKLDPVWWVDPRPD